MQQDQHHNQLSEGLEMNDLARLVHNELHIDEYKSKIGKDEDIIVFTFKVKGKEPAMDLVAFVEKGYDWVIDGDVSSGEMDDGDYLVFIETQREKDIPEQFMKLMEDLMNVTDQDLDEWRVKYKGKGSEQPLTIETLRSLVPLSPEEYKQRFGGEILDKLKTAAGVKVDTKAPKNDFTESLRAAAGII